MIFCLAHSRILVKVFFFFLVLCVNAVYYNTFAQVFNDFFSFSFLDDRTNLEATQFGLRDFFLRFVLNIHARSWKRMNVLFGLSIFSISTV